MTETDIMGWFAAAATLLTFSMRSMVPLRISALCANLCFIGYGASSGLMPVLVLHLALLPCNLTRLRQELACRRSLNLPVQLAPARMDS